MDLLVKVYNNKPSKIGIWYPFEFQAVRAYEALLLKCRNQKLILKMEIKSTGLLINVLSDFDSQLTIYRDIQFKPEQIIKMQQYFTGTLSLEFVHVFTRSNKQLTAKPFHQAEFLSIHQIEWISQQ